MYECAIRKPDVPVVPHHHRPLHETLHTYIPIFVTSHITCLVSIFMPWPPLLTGRAPSTTDMSEADTV